MGISQARRIIKNMWSHGEDEEYADSTDEMADSDEVAGTSFTDKYTSSPAFAAGHNGGGAGYAGASSGAAPSASYGGNASGGARSLRPVAMTMRAREKQIYTLRPKSQDEAAIAADYLKTGSAVVLNLEAVDRTNAVRIIDFMSGVCYGLDGQGHAMKLGEKIFLFTPGEFEITSDETDYGENRDFFFKEAVQSATGAAIDSAATPGALTAGQPAPSAYQSAYTTPSERRSWER